MESALSKNVGLLGQRPSGLAPTGLGWATVHLPIGKAVSPCALESRAALPGGEAEGRSSDPSLGGGGAASLLQVGGVGGWFEGSSLLSSWISGRGGLVSLLWVSKSLSAAAVSMCVKGASAFLAVSLEMANMFERVCVDVLSSTGREV